MLDLGNGVSLARYGVSSCITIFIYSSKNAVDKMLARTSTLVPCQVFSEMFFLVYIIQLFVRGELFCGVSFLTQTFSGLILNIHRFGIMGYYDPLLTMIN